MQYIEDHPYYHDGAIYMPFFDEAARTLRMSSIAAKGGLQCADMLEEVELQINTIKDGLVHSPSEYDHALADYLSITAQEVNVARYIEEYQRSQVEKGPKPKPKKVAEKTTKTKAKSASAKNQMEVPDDDAVKSKPIIAQPLPKGKRVINIEGPVIITTDQSFNLKSWLN